MSRVSSRTDLEKFLELRHALACRESEKSLGRYLDRVVINSSPEPRPYGQVRQPWQVDLYRDLDRAIESVGLVDQSYHGPRSFWLTLPRGHDKTSSIARRINWLLGFGRRPLSLITGAADSEQAELIVEAMTVERGLNPWLAPRIRMGRSRAYGPGGVLKVLSSDAPSSFGKNADIIILDEVTHWKKRDLWDAIISGREKRPHAVLVVLTNAGVLGSWQHEARLAAESDPRWSVYEVPARTHLATWMKKEDVDALRKFLPRGLAKQVLDNIWIDAAEETGFLTREDVLACEALGQELGLIPTQEGRSNVDYVAGIDYGPKRDRTALCVVHHGHDGRIRLDDLTVWQGSPDDPIAIRRVEEWIDSVNRRFHRPLLVIDPYQMEGTVQKYEYHQKVVRFEARGGKSNYEMASTLRSLIVNRRMVWYPGAGNLVVTRDGFTKEETLTDELCGLVIRPTLYGYRFDHEVQFHDDRAVAIGQAALFAARNPPAPEFLQPPVLDQPTRKTQLPELRPPAQGRGLWGVGHE